MVEDLTSSGPGASLHAPCSILAYSRWHTHQCHDSSETDHLLLFSHSVNSDSFWPHDCSIHGFPVLHYLPEFVQTHVHCVSDAIQASCPLSSPSPPAFNLSQNQGLFQWVSSLHQVAKVLKLQLQHQSSQWIFRIDFHYDWLVLSPCIQGTLKSLLQHHNSKASILWHSAFFMVQLSYPYMTTGKTIALARGNLLAMSLLFYYAA